jgi:hypothetical protein
VSSVHAFPSSHVSGELPTQTPFWHLSTCVQALPSLQSAPVSFTCVQLPLESQPSVVHGFESLQSGPVVPLHLPAVHCELVEHGLPSSHAVVSGTLLCVQPFSGWQPSAVQGLRSSQSSALPAAQAPLLQTSAPLQTLLSVHVVPSGCARSTGHAVDVPVQVSGASQSPVD